MSGDMTTLCRYAAEHIEGLGVCQNHADTTWFYLAYKDGARMEGSDFRGGYANFWPNYPDPSGAVALGRLRLKVLDHVLSDGCLLIVTLCVFCHAPGEEYWCQIDTNLGPITIQMQGATPAEAEFKAICSAWKAQEGK